jgi:acetyltransferase-like isoleucine patch superfamily enzyme
MKNVKIFGNVKIGKNALVEDYCIIGKTPENKKKLPTIIGDNCVIRSHSVIYAGNLIGNNFHCGHHIVIREENRIGNNVSIGSGVNIEHHVTIEDDVRLHSNVFVPELTILKKGSWIGPNVVFTNSKYPVSKNSRTNLKGATVKEGAKIGANATVLPGITIGVNCLIGGGSVVTKDIEDGKIAAGNPAQIIGSVSDLREYRV